MSEHWNRVVTTTKALAYLVKSADPDGIIELSLTSSPEKPHKTGKNETSSLLTLLEKHGSRSSPGSRACNMEHVLGILLKRVRAAHLLPKETFYKKTVDPRPLNVYILTDAIWEGREVKCGVDLPIRNLMSFMKEKGLDRTFVALQFIQFGSDELGKKRLQYLDNDLGKELKL